MTRIWKTPAARCVDFAFVDPFRYGNTFVPPCAAWNSPPTEHAMPLHRLTFRAKPFSVCGPIFEVINTHVHDPLSRSYLRPAKAARLTPVEQVNPPPAARQAAKGRRSRRSRGAPASTGIVLLGKQKNDATPGRAEKAVVQSAAHFLPGRPARSKVPEPVRGNQRCPIWLISPSCGCWRISRFSSF